MKINTNKWNRIRYSIYAPGYDIAARILDGSRKKSIESLNIKANSKILIIGAGTGLDLEHIPLKCEITATDITPKMITLTKRRNLKIGHSLNALVMDGQNLDFEDNYFDIVILHLIISVIPDPLACIKESERVLKRNGKVAIFDKFVKRNSKASTIRKIANVFTNTMFSDISRSFEDIMKHSDLSVISDTNANLNGNFRLIKLEKN